MIGVFSDSHGDLDAFNRAFDLLSQKGAKRFFFAGGRYSDLDEWLTWRREKARGGRSYSDNDFLADISNFLAHKDQVARPAAFEAASSQAAPVIKEEDYTLIKSRFLRTPEKESLQYLDPSVDRKAVDMLGDALCCVLYDKNDLNRDDLMNASLFIHGRESEPKVVQIGPRFFVTPGKLTGAAEQTCGLFELLDRQLRFSAFTLEGRTLIDRLAVGLDKRNKLSVK